MESKFVFAFIQTDSLVLSDRKTCQQMNGEVVTLQLSEDLSNSQTQQIYSIDYDSLCDIGDNKKYGDDE